MALSSLLPTYALHWPIRTFDSFTSRNQIKAAAHAQVDSWARANHHFGLFIFPWLYSRYLAYSRFFQPWTGGGLTWKIRCTQTDVLSIHDTSPDLNRIFLLGIKISPSFSIISDFAWTTSHIAQTENHSQAKTCTHKPIEQLRFSGMSCLSKPGIPN